MPPKRPPKRRTADDDAASSSARKRQGRNKREVTYDTYEEAMQGGVHMEEKGERYRDGEKAHRFYEKAVDLYKRAMEFGQTFDAAYNLARVYYTLSTSFLLPPTSVDLLNESVTLYRLAISLTDAPLLQLDAAFNLAQSCSSLAELLEIGEAYESGSSRPETMPAAMRLRIEARDALERVLIGQMEWPERMEKDGSVGREEDAADTTGSAEAASKATDITTEDAGEEESDPGMDLDDQADAADVEPTEETYEQHLPTPSSVIDTILALVDEHLSIWESRNPDRLPSEEEQSAVRSILDSAGRFITPGRQAELDLAEIKVLLTMDTLVWAMYKAQARVGSGVEKSLEGAIMALSSLLASLDAQPPDEPTVRAEILTTLADTHTTVAHRMMILAPQLPPGPSPLAQQAWYHLSQAVAHLHKALELPTTAGTLKEFKPSVLLSLSKASLARARLADVNETAKRNTPQLMENALTYAGRAAEGLGWTWLKTAGGAATTGPIVLPYPAGWDREVLARDVVFQMVRTCLYGSRTEVAPEQKSHFEQHLQTILRGLRTIREASRRITPKDVARILEDIEDEEEPLRPEETAWWEEVAVALTLS